MIDYFEVQARSLEGDHKAMIAAVELEDNSYYDQDQPGNQHKYTLSVTFHLSDPVTGDVLIHTERFIKPFTGGTRLFQQLLDLVDYLPDSGQGRFNEQSLVEKDCVITFGKNKKGYNTVVSVSKPVVDGDEPL